MVVLLIDGVIVYCPTNDPGLKFCEEVLYSRDTVFTAHYVIEFSIKNF